MTLVQFPGRLAVLQRTLPRYRAPFFDLLAQACAEGLAVFAGQPRPVETIPVAAELEHGRLIPVHNRHFLSPSSAFYFCWQENLAAELEKWQPDILIVEANPRYLSTPAAVRWMHRRGRVVLGWGLGAPQEAGGWRARSRLKFLQSLDGLIAYSREGAEQYRRMGVAPERVFVAPNAVAPKPRHPQPERAPHIETAVILFVGRLQRRKRLDLLLQACAELPQERQPQVWIVGEGPARVEFEKMAAQVYPPAQFFGAKYGAELEALFAAADLFVLPGTGGLAVQQAMTYGLPVVVARGDGTQSDLVRSPDEAGERANGWQVHPDSLVDLRETLAQALSEPGRLRQMGRESYRIVSEEINLEQMVAGFIEALSVTVKRFPYV